MLIEREKWKFWQLLLRMLGAKWQPTADGKWQHPDGATIDLHAPMKDGVAYWHQLAERNVLPPTTDVPF